MGGDVIRARDCGSVMETTGHHRWRCKMETATGDSGTTGGWIGTEWAWWKSTALITIWLWEIPMVRRGRWKKKNRIARIKESLNTIFLKKIMTKRGRGYINKKPKPSGPKRDNTPHAWKDSPRRRLKTPDTKIHHKNVKTAQRHVRLTARDKDGPQNKMKWKGGLGVPGAWCWH